MNRVFALLLRHFYIYRQSMVRCTDLIFWPIVEIAIWGFLNLHMMSRATYFATYPGLMIMTTLFWIVLFRGSITVAMSLIEEMNARNLGHLMISPLRLRDAVAALISISALKMMVGFVVSVFTAIYLFDFSWNALGAGFVLNYLNLLLFSWAMGLVFCALTLYWGPAMELICWAFSFLFGFFSGVYQPIDQLPQFVQSVSMILPSRYVFEGLRYSVESQTMSWPLMQATIIGNLLWAFIGFAALAISLSFCKKEGKLLRIGE